MTALPAYRAKVTDAWIDYNGHMSEAFYVLVFGHATDQVMDVLGMDEAYRTTTGNSLFTVEAHIRYLDQTRLGDPLEVTSVIAADAAKKLHLAHEMRSDGRLVATEELLGIHVGGDAALPFPAEVAERIKHYTVTHDLQPPDWIGRAVHC